MKIASISGITNYVKDIERTAAFYEQLGFRLGIQDDKSLTVYVNWFWVRFQLADTSSNMVESSTLLNLKVADVNEFYDEAVTKGFKPLTTPQDQPWGCREFTLQDPDGYNLVFFQKMN